MGVAVALASAGTSPGLRTPVLDKIVHDHFETFRAQAAQLRDGEGLPAFLVRPRRLGATTSRASIQFAPSCRASTWQSWPV